MAQRTRPASCDVVLRIVVGGGLGRFVPFHQPESERKRMVKLSRLVENFKAMFMFNCRAFLYFLSLTSSKT
jgi:hypothetical protein